MLSAGHSSLTLYIQLFLSGYGLELDDLKALRTWGSKTPGHPEHGHTPGVEITTGPLGQGLASAVGMAMAARRERGLFDPDAAPGESPFDHHIYVIASDGDIEEGVTSEASSLAGTQQLGNLTLIYDDNKISIEDDTTIALSEDTAKRYEAYGWHVQVVESGENVSGILDALEAARAETDRPSIILLRTIIGFPAPTKMNTGKAHGAALGADEVAEVKKILGFDPEKSFEVDEAVLAHTRQVVDRGQEAHADWQKTFDDWAAREPERKELLDRLIGRELPAGWEKALPSWEPDPKGVATRKASGEVLTALADVLPELWGGSADLAESNNTTIEGADSFGPEITATRMWKRQPVRPDAALRHPRARDGLDPQRHRAARPDPPLRRHLPRLHRLHARRGPAGRADEVAGHLRVDARLDRPRRGRPDPPAGRAPGRAAGHPGPGRACAPATPTRPPSRGRPSWSHRTGPSGLALTRQNVPVLEGTTPTAWPRAATCWPTRPTATAAGDPDRHRLRAADRRRGPEGARGRGRPTRVVSMPCVEWFDEQDQAYREKVLPPTVKARVTVEAGIAHAVAPVRRRRRRDHFASSTSGPAPTTRRCSASSASPPSTSSRPRRRSLPRLNIRGRESNHDQRTARRAQRGRRVHLARRPVAGTAAAAATWRR